MWFEILPAFSIITGAMIVPGVSIYYLHKAVLGNPYRRDMRFRWQRFMYQRDRRLRDNPYRSNGLETLAD